jgi:hypothetical protein
MNKLKYYALALTIFFSSLVVAKEIFADEFLIEAATIDNVPYCELIYKLRKIQVPCSQVRLFINKKGYVTEGDQDPCFVKTSPSCIKGKI